MAKIISIDALTKTDALPLTPLMIETLKAACEKQKNNEAFGQQDLNGSFTVLLKRLLIDCRTITINGEKQTLWFVTKAGIKALNESGINDPC